MTQQQYSRRSSFCYCSVQQKSLLNEKKPKSPDITSRLLKFLNVSAVCVFYVVMIYIFENQFFFLGAKVIIKLMQIKKKTVFYAKKNVNVCKFCSTDKGPLAIKNQKTFGFILYCLHFTVSLHLIIYIIDTYT